MYVYIGTTLRVHAAPLTLTNRLRIADKQITIRIDCKHALQCIVKYRPFEIVLYTDFGSPSVSSPLFKTVYLYIISYGQSI